MLVHRKRLATSSMFPVPFIYMSEERQSAVSSLSKKTMLQVRLEPSTSISGGQSANHSAKHTSTDQALFNT